VNFLIAPASFRGHAPAHDAQAAAEFAGRLSGPAPEGADEMAGVGVVELHGDLSDLHLALLQKRRGMPDEDAVHHRFEGGVVDAQMALQGTAGQVHFPGYPVNARPAFEQGQPDEVLDAFHDVARVGHGRLDFDDAGRSAGWPVQWRLRGGAPITDGFRTRPGRVCRPPTPAAPRARRRQFRARHDDLRFPLPLAWT
jgi:hypothetical protein